MQKIYGIHFSEIDSTASWVETHYQELKPEGITCVTADVQTAGQGQRSRVWVSKEGNLHMTLFYHLKKGDACIPNLAQFMALAFCEVFPAKIKWPNDLQVEGVKVAGILVKLLDCVETFGVVHSIGVNVHTQVETDQPTITLQEWTGHTYNLDTLAKTLTHALIAELQKGFSAKTFNAKLAYRDQKMTCRQGKTLIKGVVRGIDSNGKLEMELESGEVIYLMSGELTF
jgi:BirA family biotin operon repressor/biotin-[acetyl-CoA-carboxylase] ligase